MGLMFWSKRREVEPSAPTEGDALRAEMRAALEAFRASPSVEAALPIVRQLAANPGLVPAMGSVQTIAYLLADLYDRGAGS